MSILLPDKNLLLKTCEVDYFDWNYKFPLSLFQKYRFKKIVKLLGRENYGNLLEIGMGSGIFLPELSKHSKNLFAIDIHDKLDNIHNLCRLNKIEKYNISTQSIEFTNFPDNFFDVIVAVSALEFVQDLNAAISEITRILKTDGIFITICPMESKFLDFMLSFYSSKPAKEEFNKSRQYVTKMLESNFIIIEKGYMIPIIGKFFPVYTHYKLKKLNQEPEKLYNTFP